MAQKGGNFERSICKTLSLWWTDGENDNVFWRTSQSGGRATTRAKSGKTNNTRHCGDICAIDPIGEPLLKVITWECKVGYNRDTIHDLLDKRPGAKQQRYEEWVEKAERDRERAGSLYWAIVHKRDMRLPTILLPGRFFYGRVMGSDGFIQIRLRDEDGIDYASLPLEDFLVSVSPSHIRKIAKDLEKKT